MRVSCAKVSVPAGATAFAVPETSLIANPGRLSIVWTPGYNNIVVFSTISLFDPLTYENLAASRSAL